MTKKLLWLFALLPLFGLTACKSKANEPPKPLEPGSYITGYVNSDRIFITDVYNDVMAYGEKSVYWRYDCGITKAYLFYSKDSEKYQELSILYGDTAFYANMLPEDNGKKRIAHDSSSLQCNPSGVSILPSRALAPFEALWEPVVAIDAVALDDYDEDHPKGSSLNDIASVFYYECLTYIQSGYNIGCYPFRGRKCVELSYFPEEPIKLMEAFQQILLMRAPATADNHKVRLIYRFEDGSELSRTFETNRVTP